MNGIIRRSATFMFSELELSTGKWIKLTITCQNSSIRYDASVYVQQLEYKDSS